MLSQNTLVLCDRYVYSSFAYQGDADLQELVRTLNKDFPTPDCVFYFDIDTEEALKRITRTKDSMEQFTFLHEVKMRYERMFETPLYNSQTHERIPVYAVDARCDEETIAQEVLTCTLALLNKEHKTHGSYVTLSKAHQNIS